MKITVVTVCRNAENEIERTAKSVIEQCCDDFEYIIVDGKSTDSTIQIVKKLNDEYSSMNRLKYISEKDNGIYNAMNKAIGLSNGKWILFLNAGDTFYTDMTLHKVDGLLDDKFDFVYGDTNYIEDGDEYIVASKPITEIKKRMPFCHQSVFAKKSILELFKFNEEYKICADYDLFLRAYRDCLKFKQIHEIVSNYSVGGYSKKNQSRLIRELTKIKYDNGIIKFRLPAELFLSMRVMAGKLFRTLLPQRAVKMKSERYK